MRGSTRALPADGGRADGGPEARFGGRVAQRPGADGDPARGGRAGENAVRVAVPDSHGRVGQAPVGDEAAGGAGEGPEGHWVLCKHLGLTGPEEANRIYQELFREEPVTSGARALLAWVFRNRSQEYER